ncbi:MAG: signal recognition particle protein [Tissierellia bacterium]|jgi:signal recognition particle subunit SRP54|nr:signal recognition particle protein [Tissierellia bacterium]
MFGGLSEKLQNALNKLSGKGKVNEKDIKDVMREVRLSLLEADVNYRVVKQFVAQIQERALGAEVMESLTPGSQVIKIVRDELTRLMGSTSSKLTFNSNGPSIYMIVGLQGSGKTTNGAKLAAKLREKGKRPLLVALDIYRPAAIDQLHVLGKQLDIPVFSMGDQKSPVDIAKAALDEAYSTSRDVLILDTAGRLHLDEGLMQELKDIKKAMKPTEILLVVDAMVGQDAVTVAGSFHEQLGIDGIIMTKLDGDTRGGSALSMKEVTGAPIKFVGTGEKITGNTLEEFHPDRMASRILGMGDVLSLIERAEKNYDAQKAQALEQKMRQEGLDFDDFLEQMQQMREMGGIGELLGMLPGLGGNMKAMQNLDMDDKEIKKVEAIIQSMTKKERKNPDLLNARRKQRIALGSGASVQDVNKLVKQFSQTRKMMKQFTSMSKKGKNPFGGMRLPF